MEQQPANAPPPHHSTEPSQWVVRFAPLIAPHGTVLDLACGRGRNARYLAKLGHRVLAVDRDSAALESMRATAGIETLAADLERGAWPLGDRKFDAIVVTNYLHRPQFRHLLDALQPDGVLIYETFADGNARFGSPSRPEFLLQPDELLSSFGTALRVVAFEQGQTAAPAVIQRLCAVGRARDWPPRLIG
jgi:SAM-dependent methyltransferase